MRNIFVISDTHFFHEKMLTFTRPDGTPVRPGFASAAEVNECIADHWAQVVRPEDHIYHLGDVAFGPSLACAALVKSLPGKKRLVRGNHDRYTTKQYLAMGFEEIHGMRLMEDVWLTHAPIHPESMGRALGNIHGHIHANPSPSGPYFNACVEAINYTPVNVDIIREWFRTRPARLAAEFERRQVDRLSRLMPDLLGVDNWDEPV
jgi:calcineurin-like phosphoesterase family protein